MLKELVAGITKFFDRKELVIGVIIVLIGVALLSYSNSKSYSLDNYDDGYNSASAGSYSDQTNSLKQPSVRETSAQNIVAAPVGAIGGAAGYQMRPVANPSDLLPSDSNSEWAALNPSMNAGSTPDMLQAGYHIGLDTIGQSLRNANQQLRSDPIIPKADIGPWSQSTIEADIGRVPLEIGYGGR